MEELTREELIEAASKYVPRKLAAKKSDNYLIAFLEARANEEGRLNSAQGSRGLSAGTMTRRNYGV